jgi:2-keto-4-pentenoate hydratase
VVPVDPRLEAALGEQLRRRRAVLAGGARHVGWKLGMGDRERIGGSVAVGYLTSATVLEPGATYAAAAGADLHADAEAVVELGGDTGAEIARYGAAIEIVDLGPLPGEPESVVAANVFHRAVAFAELAAAPSADLEVRVSVNGDPRASARWPDDLPDRIAAAARVLASVGERLRAGDRVITGSIVQVAVGPGDEVVADFGGLARLRLRISRR